MSRTLPTPPLLQTTVNLRIPIQVLSAPPSVRAYGLRTSDQVGSSAPDHEIAHVPVSQGYGSIGVVTLALTEYRIFHLPKSGRLAQATSLVTHELTNPKGSSSDTLRLFPNLDDPWWSSTSRKVLSPSPATKPRPTPVVSLR